jgi:2-methylisocitrate lyase-like PEP mutase family enzyme
MASLNLDEVIRRLRAYADAGADCVYAPGVRALDQTLAIVQSVNRPVNANLTATGLSVADFAAIGVRRVSIGAALAKATYDTFDLFAERLMGEGRLP